MNMKKLIAVGALLPFAALAEEPAVVTTTEAQAEKSVEVANQDAEIVISAKEKIQEAFDAFLEKKASDGVMAYGQATEGGITYYAEMQVVNALSKADPDFAKKREAAFMRAFSKIRNNYIRYTFNSVIETCETGEFLHDSAAQKQQDLTQDSALKRMGKKLMALTEAQLDKKLAETGKDPSTFGTTVAKRKYLADSIVRNAVLRSFGSCAGISVVKTMIGKGSDGKWAVGVIAKYDPVLVSVAECMARKVRPAVAPKAGIPVSQLLKGRVTEQFGVRFYYDQNGLPALLAFGQWGAPADTGDVMESDLLEKSARDQAIGMADLELSNFIAGCVSFTAANKAGEEYSKSITYDERGCPNGFETKTDIIDFVNQRFETKALDTGAGRDIVLNGRVFKDPSTGAKVVVAAVSWTFSKVDNLVRDKELRKGRPLAAQGAKAESKASDNGKAELLEGDETDF